MTGFEPATSGSTIRRSNQLSYTHRAGLRGKLRKLDLSKVRRTAATHRPSGSGIKRRLHFTQNRRSCGSGIGSGANGTTDHEIIGTRRDGLSWSRRPRMIVDVFTGGADARSHDEKPWPDFRPQHPRLLA